MKNGSPDVNPHSVVEDIRRGMTDAALMKKHGLSPDQLSELFERLLIKGYIPRKELEARSLLRLSEEDIEDLATDLADGLFYGELEEKYGLSEADLHKSLRMLVEQGLASDEHIGSAVRGVNPRQVVRDVVANASNKSLMEKYGLSEEQLLQLFDSLVARSFLSLDDLGERYTIRRPRHELSQLAADVKRGLFHEEFKEKYGLSDADLHESFRTIVDKGLASHEDIQSAVSAVNPRDAVEDVLGNASNESLMEKYDLSEDELFQLFDRLVARSFLAPEDRRERYPAQLSEEDLEDLAADLRKGAFFEELREEYGLSEDELQECFKVLAAKGMASRNAIQSAVKAVNPREVVPDIRADMTDEDLRKKYALSEQELFQLFDSLVTRSFLSPDELGDRHTVAPPVEEPPMVKVYETNNFVEIELAKSLLRSAGIVHDGFSPQTRSPLHSDPGMVEIFAEEARAEEARRLLAELQETLPSAEGEAAPEETETAHCDQCGEEPPHSGPSCPRAVLEDTSPDDPGEDRPDSGPAWWIQLLGIAVLIVVLCYLLGLFDL